MENNNQNGNQPNWFDRNKWFLLALLVLLLLFWKNFHAEFGFSEPSSSKRDSVIVNAINNNGNKVVGAVNDNGNKIGSKIDQVGEKVDKNTETSKNGFKQVVDTVSNVGKKVVSELKKKCFTCKEKKPCKPKPTKKPCPPIVKAPTPTQKDTTLDKKPKVAPCPEAKAPVAVVKKPCEYILWNPDRTKSKVFATAEARKEFADAHGLIIHVEN